MDPTVQVALIGIAAAIVTTIGLVVVAVINSRRERSDSAQKAMERVHRERLNFKDDVIRETRRENDELEQENKQLKKELAECQQSSKGDRNG